MELKKKVAILIFILGLFFLWQGIEDEYRTMQFTETQGEYCNSAVSYIQESENFSEGWTFDCSMFTVLSEMQKNKIIQTIATSIFLIGISLIFFFSKRETVKNK